MSNLNLAVRAYTAASANRTIREQEADIFFLVMARLQNARQSGPTARVRALADNRRLWMLIADLVRDDGNSLPPATRAGILSIARCVQREMDADEPSIDFLVSINKNMAEGLSGNP